MEISPIEVQAIMVMWATIRVEFGLKGVEDLPKEDDHPAFLALSKACFRPPEVVVKVVREWIATAQGTGKAKTCASRKKSKAHSAN